MSPQQDFFVSPSLSCDDIILTGIQEHVKSSVPTQTPSLKSPNLYTEWLIQIWECWAVQTAEPTKLYLPEFVESEQIWISWW